ncbi:probable carboxylesterase 7 [Eucalyptus grandis]|uniref:probable carboxylesterase 7 n=1 Tax=Eucalyptus grandis TaxID=71139 RepID=UPI00192F0A18|nr:probable carboxylesterase 7 [Eucalyptus grandis]
MDPRLSEVAHVLVPAVRIYKDGRVERLMGTATVSPSLGEKTGVQSKDVAISSDSSVSARLYIPKAAIGSLHKLPVPVYFHRGGFTFETAQSPTYHNYLNALVAEANITAISVDYRRAPKHPLLTAYNDSWTSLKWVASHFAGNGPEEWLNSHANLSKVFMAGDNAGGNIDHNMGIQLGGEKLNGVEIAGAIMELLSESGWSGAMDVMEAPREDHLFHLLNPSYDNAKRMMKKLASFISKDN